MEKKITTTVTKGLLLGLILIVINIIIYLTGIYLQTWAAYIGFSIFAIGVLWSIINYGKEKDNHVTFGDLFAHGFKVSATVLCLMIIYVFLSAYLFPDMKDKIVDFAKNKALASPGANSEQVEKGMEMFANHYTLFIVVGTIFWYLLIGVISSLIGAAVTKKVPQSPFENQP